MKKWIFCGAAFLLTAAAPLPAPKGFVNDFANVIPDDREVTIERSLRAYEAKTTIEIGVATVPSLEGEDIETYSVDLFRKWGLGKKGANNGILIVVAPNEPKYRVEVGYGLEGDLPDATVSELAVANLPDAFRANDFGGGIKNLTDAIIQHLGDMTPDQRALFHRRMENAKKQRAFEARAAMFSFFGTLLEIAISLGIIAGILLVIRSLIRKRKAWLKRKQSLKDANDYLTNVHPEPDRLRGELASIDLPNLPAWMQDDKERYITSFDNSLVEARKAREKMLALMETDPVAALSLKGEIDAALESAQAFVKQLQGIPEAVVAFRRETAEVVASACSEIDGLVSQVGGLTQRKYRVADLVPAIDLVRLGQEKNSITSLLENRGEGQKDASEVVHDKATRLLAKVQALKKSLNAAIELQSASTRRIAALRKRIETFPTLLQEYQERLQRLRELAPKQRWLSFEAGMPVFERTLTGIEPRTDAAERANGMETQLFSDAATMLTAAETALGTIDAAVAASTTLETAIVKAKQAYPDTLHAVHVAIASARSNTSNSDVGRGAKSRLEEAERLLKNLPVGGSSVDWIAVNELLAQVSAKATQASQLAQNDIDAAERERRRQEAAEEAAKQRAEQAAAAAASAASSGNDSNDSFGGFGGGSSGGGGASGDW